MTGGQFSNEWETRYSRQIRMPEIGEEGQQKLLDSKVLILGAGGLGSPAALYLAAAGIGTIGIADGDIVELSNLQRQILHGNSDIGRAKTESAAESISRLNPDLLVVMHPIKADENKLPELTAEYDFVLDCTDSYQTKLLISDACVKTGTPFCSGSVVGLYGQVMTWAPEKGPCFRCIFRDSPDGVALKSEELGVLGASAGVIGCLQAAETIKYLLGAGELLTGQLLLCDLLTMEFQKIPLQRSRQCPACGKAAETE